MVLFWPYNTVTDYADIASRQTNMLSEKQLDVKRNNKILYSVYKRSRKWGLAPGHSGTKP